MNEYTMEKYNIWIKILILGYVVWKSMYLHVDIGVIVVFILINVALNLGCFIFKNKISNILIIIEASINLYFTIYLMPYAASIYAINIFEGFKDIKELRALKIFILSIPIWNIRGQEFIITYIFASCTIYIFFKFYNDGLRVLLKLNSEVDDNRSEIYILNNRLKQQEEYRVQAMYNVKLQERNNLSQKMHDKVGHTIAAALMQLEAIKIMLDKDTDKSVEMLNNTIRVLRIGMDDIRKTLREIKPSNEEIGINKIKTMLDEKIQNTNFSFVLTHKGDLNKINYGQWIVIYDAIRELTTNSFKYSNGNKITVNIEIFNKLIKVETKDNGQGTNKVEKGIGITSIEQRIAELEGKTLIYANDGFTVVLLLPIKE